MRDLPTYTRESAKIMQLKNVGLIDKNMKADLLIFESNSQNELMLNDLLYVIKNGKIVYKK